MLDALPHCVFLVGPDRTVLGVNAAADTLLGSSARNVIGKPLHEVMSSLAGSDGEQVDLNGAIDRCTATGEAQLLDGWLRRSESQSAAQTGELDKVTVTILPAGSGKGQEQVALIIDGESVRPPYGLRDAVLSMVSHELRTPLLHIKGFVSTLLESDIQWDEETRLDFLRTIDREADRLTAMVSDLMEITRMGSVDLPLHLEDADPYLLAHAALDSASPFIRKHRVVVEIPEDLPKVTMDVLRVTGVLVNLIQNSSKYSEEGTTIVIGARSDGAAVTFSVGDEGAGIPPEVQDRIFSMFYRGEQTDQSSPGTGLGLAVCKAVVDAHGGRIWVESEVGAGSTFKFTIPYRLPGGRTAKAVRRKKAAKKARSVSSVKRASAGKRKTSGTASKRSGRAKVAVAR